MCELYDAITANIIAELEQGTVPWTKPWKGGNAGGLLPHNAATNRPYSGINILILWSRGYGASGWLTYKQAQAAGAQVRKGERGTTVVFYSPRTINEDEEDERTIWMMRKFVVFNVEQIDGLPAPEPPQPIELRHEQAHALIQATGASIKHGGDRAAFIPSKDLIMLPPLEAFRDEESYLATATHELIHWTGPRLERKGGTFGTEAYAFEELVAELGSAFLCAHLGIRGELQHASYIGNWIQVLKNDKRAVFKAASQASKAVAYILGPQLCGLFIFAAG